MTGPRLTKINTFRSTEEERERWDQQQQQQGFPDFTAFVRARLNGEHDQPAAKPTEILGIPVRADETAPPDVVEMRDDPEVSHETRLRVLPAPDRPTHHPRCQCRMCAPQG